MSETIDIIIEKIKSNTLIGNNLRALIPSIAIFLNPEVDDEREVMHKFYHLLFQDDFNNNALQ